MSHKDDSVKMKRALLPNDSPASLNSREYDVRPKDTLERIEVNQMPEHTGKNPEDAYYDLQETDSKHVSSSLVHISSEKEPGASNKDYNLSELESNVQKQTSEVEDPSGEEREGVDEVAVDSSRGEATTREKIVGELLPHSQAMNDLHSLTQKLDSSPSEDLNDISGQNYYDDGIAQSNGRRDLDSDKKIILIKDVTHLYIPDAGQTEERGTFQVLPDVETKDDSSAILQKAERDPRIAGSYVDLSGERVQQAAIAPRELLSKEGKSHHKSNLLQVADRVSSDLSISLSPSLSPFNPRIFRGLVILTALSHLVDFCGHLLKFRVEFGTN